jgi:hypothetical protein
MTLTTAEAHTLIDELLGKALERSLPALPAIEACDPWELTSRRSRGRTRYTLTIACSERRRNGYSNHAFAEIWFTDNTLRCAWSHGQGHNYEETSGNIIGTPFRKSKSIYHAIGAVLAHVCKFARHDADIYVIR